MLRGRRYLNHLAAIFDMLPLGRRSLPVYVLARPGEAIPGWDAGGRYYLTDKTRWVRGWRGHAPETRKQTLSDRDVHRMRTTAEAQNSPPDEAGAAATARRGRAVARPGAAPSAAVPPSPGEPQSVAVATVRMLRIDEGLYALRVGEIAGKPGDIAGMAVPAVLVSAPFAEDGNGVEIVASFPRRGPWLGKDGGTMIVRSPIGGGYLVVTVYGDAEQHQGEQTSQLSLDLQRLDAAGNGAREAGPAAALPVGGQAPPPAEPRDTPTEILLHIERAGDRLFPGRGWVGALGRRMRVEAFSIRPLERLLPTDIEMKGFLPNGGETAWVPGGVLCGTRGRGLPLTGFAVRVVPQQADRFEVVYQGSFFAGGISQTHQNGDPCRAATADDPLEAINVRLIERGAAGSAGAT